MPRAGTGCKKQRRGRIGRDNYHSVVLELQGLGEVQAGLQGGHANPRLRRRPRCRADIPLRSLRVPGLLGDIPDPAGQTEQQCGDLDLGDTRSPCSPARSRTAATSLELVLFSRMRRSRSRGNERSQCSHSPRSEHGAASGRPPRTGWRLSRAHALRVHDPPRRDILLGFSGFKRAETARKFVSCRKAVSVPAHPPDQNRL